MNTSITTWDDFIQKLQIIKKEKLLDRVSVPAMTNLLYAGAFDSLLPNITKENILKTYQKCYEEMKAVTGSKAKLPGKSKTSIIGIADITTPAHLAMWRQGNSPIGVYPFIDSLKENLGILGYTLDPNTGNYKKKNDKVIHVVTDNWSNIFNYYNSPVWDMIQSKQLKMEIIGILTKAELKLVSNNSKEMMKVSIFTGRENIEDLIIWPEWGKTQVSPVYKNILTTGNLYLFSVTPKLDKDKKGGYITNVQKFQN